MEHLEHTCTFLNTWNASVTHVVFTRAGTTAAPQDSGEAKEAQQLWNVDVERLFDLITMILIWYWYIHHMISFWSSDPFWSQIFCIFSKSVSFFLKSARYGICWSNVPTMCRFDVTLCHPWWLLGVTYVSLMCHLCVTCGSYKFWSLKMFQDIRCPISIR